jgi:hypothetical protein
MPAPSMMTPLQCRSYAEQCTAASKSQEHSMVVRRALVHLAKSWTAMARDIERYERAVLLEQPEVARKKLRALRA